MPPAVRDLFSYGGCPKELLTERVGEGVGVEMQETKAIDRLTDGDLRATRQDLRLPIQYDEEGIVACCDGELDRLVLGDDQGAHRQRVRRNRRDKHRADLWHHQWPVGAERIGCRPRGCRDNQPVALVAGKLRISKACVQRDHRARLTLEERHIIERLSIVRTIDLHREKHTALRRIRAIEESRQEWERLLDTAIREEAQSPHVEPQDGRAFGKDPTGSTK